MLSLNDIGSSNPSRYTRSNLIHSRSDSLPAGHGLLKVTTLDPPSSSTTEPDNLKRIQINFPIVRFSYPLKLIVSRSYYNPLDRLQIGLVYLLNYGGGLVSGDHLSIDIELGHKCHLLCLSQGSTKVYKEKVGVVDHSSSKPSQNPRVLYPNPPPGSSTNPTKPQQPTRQDINARIGSNATLLMLPSYVTCFRDSSFTQKQTYHLQDQTSSLICLDWFTSGRTHSTRLHNVKKQGINQDSEERMSMIESWTFKKFQSFVEIYVSSKRILRDNLVLMNQDHRHLDQNKFTVYANLFLVCSTGNTRLLKIFDKLLDLDRANKTQPHRQQNKNGKDQTHNEILWCFSEISISPTSNQTQQPTPKTIIECNPHQQQFTNRKDTTSINLTEDQDPKTHKTIITTKVGIARIGSHSTILVRRWLETNLVDLIPFIGPEFYNNCF